MGARQARHTGWMYQLPPWRAPHIRRHHHHHHDVGDAIAGGIGSLIGRTLLGCLFFEVWFTEFLAWTAVWFYYGLFLGARWVWRHNPIGQTIDTVHAAKERSRPVPYDPHGAPPQQVDLGQLRRRA